MDGASGQSLCGKQRRRTQGWDLNPLPRAAFISSDDRVPMIQGPPTRSQLLKVPQSLLILLLGDSSSKSQICGRQPHCMQATAPLSQARRQLTSQKPCQPLGVYYSVKNALFKTQLLSACPVGLGEDVLGDWKFVLLVGTFFVSYTCYLHTHLRWSHLTPFVDIETGVCRAWVPTFAQSVGGMAGTKTGCGCCSL